MLVSYSYQDERQYVLVSYSYQDEESICVSVLQLPG